MCKTWSQSRRFRYTVQSREAKAEIPVYGLLGLLPLIVRHAYESRKLFPDSLGLAAWSDFRMRPSRQRVSPSTSPYSPRLASRTPMRISSTCSSPVRRDPWAVRRSHSTASLPAESGPSRHRSKFTGALKTSTRSTVSASAFTRRRSELLEHLSVSPMDRRHDHGRNGGLRRGDRLF